MLNALQRWLQQRAAPSGNAAQGEAVVPIPGQGPLLIDVRTAREHSAGTLPGALHVPLSQLESWVVAAVPDRTRPLRLFCASGARSANACLLLRQLGYSEVENSGGLLAASVRLNLPVTTP